MSLMSLLLILLLAGASASPPPPLTKGLSWTFYSSTCPQLDSLVRSHLARAFRRDPGLAAGLLRLHFHDCFVQGCDASVLLAGSAAGPGEQDAPPNLSLRPSALAAVSRIRALVDRECGPRVVSCADVAALAARDSVHLSGGPDYPVPLGRRDGLAFATRNATLSSLPAPTSNASVLLAAFSKLNLDATDLVALSGGHTIGLGHCGSFSNRLYPTQDATMDEGFAKRLYRTCPSASSGNTTALDVLTPEVFDNGYYVNLVRREGLFTSDQDLYMDGRTRGIVEGFAAEQGVFFERFAAAMVKMGQMGVLTGGQGEIRSNCSARNAEGREFLLGSVVEEEGDGVRSSAV